MDFTYETLCQTLTSLGFKNIKKLSSTRLAVLVDTDRVKALEKIQAGIPKSKYDTSPSYVSSIGMVIINKKFMVLAKPLKKQGASSAGIDNEHRLINAINSETKSGPINICFKAKNKTFTILGCKKAVGAGSDTSGRKKADVNLIDIKGKVYPISIKKDNAEYWESADAYFNTEAKRILKNAVEEDKTKLSPQIGGYFTVTPNIAVKATREETKDIVFGSDILPNGCIITKTFTSSSFQMDGDTLNIEVSSIIKSLSDIPLDKEVYFLIRNDKSRKSLKEYPGIRILAAYKKRITSKIVVVDR